MCVRVYLIQAIIKQYQFQFMGFLFIYLLHINHSFAVIFFFANFLSEEDSLVSL